MRALSFVLTSLLLLTASLWANAIPTIRVGDLFDLRLLGVPPDVAADFSMQYIVGPEGTVNVPLIDEIKVNGLTATQAERAIQTKMIADKIFTRPTVVINVSPMARFISVGGAVRTPQRFQWSEDLTLTTSIGNVGGPDDYADEKRVRLIRDGKFVGTFDLRTLRTDPSRDPKLMPGDQVYVPGR